MVQILTKVVMLLVGMKSAFMRGPMRKDNNTTKATT